MSLVYQVRHEELGTLHALKVLTIHTRNVRARLEQEGHLQRLLRHPNIVSVTEVITVAHSPSLVMDYVAGPDLAALRAGAAAGRAAVAVARRERRPDLAVQYRTGKREGSSGTQIGLGLSMPLVDWGQISGSVKAARATVASQEQTLAQAELDAGLEVEEAYRQALSTREIAESYSERIGARAERLAEVFQMSYERGGSTLLEVIDAEETLTETQMSRVQATADHRSSLVELLHAVGGLLPE